MSINIYLLRHGEAASSWENELDPGLSLRGHEQARVAASRFQTEAAVALFSSPLRRTRETSQPFGDIWGQGIEIAPELSEVPSAGVDFGDRRRWLTHVLEGNWPDQSPDLQVWRATILDFAKRQTRDAIFVTHFVVINAIVGAIEKSDKLVVFRPDHCSVTKIRLQNGELSMIEKGAEAVTVVK
ncbi:histidine phosphatase family protein [Sneathiella sp.]|uniref:histidine phosphatase family protein n=1 Tax=Sneathiella sp. TaxID=1964365 RepID=UPI0035643701